MHSPLADEARRALAERSRRMPPVQRLKAFCEQSRLLVELREAGRKFRRMHRPAASP